MGYCPIVLQKERKLYCNTVIVLQRRGLRVGNFIAIQQIVLQGGVVGWEELYCKRGNCIAIEAAWLLEELYCNTV